MITSSSLGIIPFVSNTDATRLQMAAKQLSQSCSHSNCRRPYVIGEDYHYLSEMSKLYKHVAPCDGDIMYSGADIMIVFFNDPNDTKNSYIKTFETPLYKHCANGFATKLSYQSEVGSFKKGDIIFEYDSFIENVPVYGYNLNSAYMPWFGMNFEDAVVISESASKLMKCNKVENVIIPIYKQSLFRNLYPESKHNFIPEIGQKIKNNVILYQSIPKVGSNSKQLMGSIDLYNIPNITDDNFLFNSIPTISKLPGGTVSKIKIHHINKKLKMIDKNLEKKIKGMLTEYYIKIREVYKSVSNSMYEDYAKKLLSSHYMMLDSKQEKIENGDELLYIIELEVSKEYDTQIGDKLSTRFAGKGVVSQIIPDDLRPINSNGEPIDVIMSPLGVFSRMNFGVTIEGLVSKIIKKCENDILINENNINQVLNNLVKVSDILGNKEYSKKIRLLNTDIHTDSNTKSNFIKSVKRGGLFFEAPCFANFDVKQLIDLSIKIFGITTNDSIKIKKETFEWVKTQQPNLDIPLPEKDVIYNDIYNAPLYIIKLMQLSEHKINVRDFGDYSASKKQPKADKDNLNKASKIGNMEFDAFLSHNNMNVIRELRTVKSDALNLKSEMVSQLINNGVYDLPSTKPKSYTRDIIKAYIKFLNEN
jgi:DNA-directed RNA polymerase beta subunit